MAKSIGYVPQKIYLIDDTINANIAFGVERRSTKMQLSEQQKYQI